MGGQRMLLHLVGGPDGSDVWRALDLPLGRFVTVESPDQSSILDDWPYGLEVFLQDLEGLMNGELDVWDVLGVALRHWSPPGPSIPEFFCLTFAESVRVEGTALRLAHTLSELGRPTCADQLLEQDTDGPFDGDEVD